MLLKCMFVLFEWNYMATIHDSLFWRILEHLNYSNWSSRNQLIGKITNEMIYWTALLACLASLLYGCSSVLAFLFSAYFNLYVWKFLEQMPIREACHVAVQKSNPNKQKLWKHAQARQRAKGQGPIPVLQIVCLITCSFYFVILLKVYKLLCIN